MKRLSAILLVLVITVSCLSISALAASDADKDAIGLYTISGYTNKLLGFKIELPADYELQPRGINLGLTSDALKTANDDNTINYLASMLALGSAQNVFSAEGENAVMSVTMNGLSLMYDSFEDEKVLAEKQLPNFKEQLTEAGYTVEDAIVDKDMVAGKEHYGVAAHCTYMGVRVYALEIMIRSNDGKYVAVLDIQSWDEDEMNRIPSYLKAY